NARSSCRSTTSSVRLDSRSGRVSPTQRIGVSPLSTAARVLRATMSSLSPKMCLRSEWPRMTWLQPTCFSIAGEISPVKASSRSQCMFWAPSKTSLPRNASATAARAVKGGATSTSRSFSGRARPARMSWASATPSGSVLYIFQLPAISGRLMRPRGRPLRAARRRLLEQAPRQLDLVLFDQALARDQPLGAQEGIGHAAAHEERVDLGQQVLDDLDLVGDLGPAQHGHVGMIGRIAGHAQVAQLL